MTKGLKLKQILFMILIFISSIVILPTVNLYAAGGFDNYTGGSGNTENLDESHGGPTLHKSGWIIQLVDDSGHPILGSKTCYFGYNGANPTTSEPTAWFGETVNAVKTGTIVNTIPFLKSDNENLNGCGGDVLGSKLEEDDPSTGNQYAHQVIFNCLGVDKTAFLEYLASGKPLYLQLTGVYWCRQPDAKSFTGQNIAGNTYQMATHIAMSGTYGSYFAHHIAPNSSHLLKPTWGISNINPLPDRVKATATEIKAMGLGLGQLELSDSYQVVICIESPSGWTTTYLSTGQTYNVLNPYQGATFVEGCVNTRKTKEKSASSTYTQVRTNVEPGGKETRAAGVGAFKFDTATDEHALFLHYKIAKKVETTTEADLYAWELGYRMPQAGGAGHGVIRVKANTEDYGVKLDEVIYKWQMSTRPKTPAPTKTEEYQWIVKSKSERHTYKVSGSQGDFTKSIWNLYRKTAPHYDLWEKYNVAIGVKIWNGWDKVDPKFSYYLMRSQLEGLALRPVPSSGLSSMLVAGKGANFEDNWKDIGRGAGQGADTKKTWQNVCTYKFTYTGTVINEQIMGRAEAWIRWQLQIRTRYWIEESGSVEDGTYVEGHYSEWSDWSNEGAPKEFKQKSFSPDKWNGTYASYNIDKYKVQATGTGQSEQAGNYTVAKGGTDGLDINGNLASQIGKGSAQTLATEWKSTEIHNAATHASQFKNNIYNLYGEVEMVYWKNASSDIYTPSLTATNVYVMSEYERHIIPPLVHGFKTSIIGGKMTGMGSLTTPATGKTASDVQSSSSATDIGVTYMGTGFNVATTAKYRIDFGTAGLTISGNDDGANAIWGNKKTDVLTRHQRYMNSVLNGIGQRIIMEFTFKPSGQKVYYELLTSDDKGYTQSTQELGKDDVSFKRGSASGGNASAIEGYTNGGVEGFLALTRMFDGTMISEKESYKGQKNSSGPAHENNLATHSGRYTHMGYSNWYDEESNHRFCIEKYHSWVIFDYVQAEDKIDYNLLTQNVASKYLNQSKYIEVRFYNRLFRNNVDYTDGLYSWPGSPTLRIDKIKDMNTGADLSFSVINQSTSDMKKN